MVISDNEDDEGKGEDEEQETALKFKKPGIESQLLT